MRLWSRVARLAATITLVGCTPNTAPSISPAPTYSCTPEAGGPSYRCTQSDYDQMKRQEALYAEGEEVFRRYIAEIERTDRAGGGDVLTKEFAELLGTKKLRQGHLDSLQIEKERRMIVKGGDAYKIAWLDRKPGLSREGSDIAIAGCIDNRSDSYYEKGKVVSKGVVIVETLYLKKVDGHLMIWVITARDPETCAR